MANREIRKYKVDSDKIYDLLKQKGISFRSLGYNVKTVNYYFNKGELPLPLFYEIAAKLGVAPSELIDARGSEDEYAIHHLKRVVDDIMFAYKQLDYYTKKVYK